MKRKLILLWTLLLLWGCRATGPGAALSAEPTLIPLTPRPQQITVEARTPADTLSPRPSPTPQDVSEGTEETPPGSGVSPEPNAMPTSTPQDVSEEAEETPPGSDVSPEPRDPNRPMIALTFDDGPTEYTAQVLDLLERYEAKGTFFVIGSSLSESTRPILQRMTDLGCDIGMHDLNHSNLTRLSTAANTRRIQKMQALISAQIDGGYQTHLLRPPYGSLNKAVRRACRATDVASIRWSVDTRDWSNKSPKTILQIVQREAKDGAIILFHDRLPTTVTALEAVILYLQDQGYDLVTVTELLESSGEPIRYGEDYQRKPRP